MCKCHFNSASCHFPFPLYFAVGPVHISLGGDNIHNPQSRPQSNHGGGIHVVKWYLCAVNCANSVFTNTVQSDSADNNT